MGDCAQMIEIGTARLYDDWSTPPLTQTLESLQEEFAISLVLKAVSGSRLMGSVRAKLIEGPAAF
jgi:hypothetical protein